MKLSYRRMLLRTALLMVSLGLALPASPQAQPAAKKISVHLDPARTDIQWTLSDVLHTVHGTFGMKGGIVTYDPQTGAAEGEIVIELATGKSGSHARDERMQQNVLESVKYPHAIFHPTRVSGAVKPGATQNVTVDGTFTIHGADHPLQLQVQIQMDGPAAVATTHFNVPYVAWGMKDPSTLMLRVGKVVSVDVVSRGSIDGLE